MKPDEPNPPLAQPAIRPKSSDDGLPERKVMNRTPLNESADSQSTRTTPDINGSDNEVKLVSTYIRFRVLKVLVCEITETQLVLLILNASADRKGLIFTYATADTIVRANFSSNFQDCIGSADFCYADGMGVVVAVRSIHGNRIVKVTANNFFPDILEGIIERGLRVAVIGGTPGVAEAAVINTLKEKGLFRNHPSFLTPLCRCYSGYFTASAGKQILQELSTWRPHLVILGMGQPRQEEWARIAQESLPGTTFHCVGGLLDYYSGRISRPPQWMREHGLEWFFRLQDQPSSNWRRYLLGLPVFLYLVLRESIKQRRIT